MSLEDNYLFERFCERMAAVSISHYLLVRWSYSTYLDSNKKKTESVIAKLDSSLLRRFSLEAATVEAINERTKAKLELSNYTENCNVFFEKLFHLPEKLKKYDKPKRNDKLREYMRRVSDKFFKQKGEYLDGIVFPIGTESSVVTSIATDHCFTFSTKERVPFKLVVETIGFEDAFRMKAGEQPEYKEAEEAEEGRGFILPASYFGPEWAKTRAAISAKSIYGKIRSHRIQCFMVKSGDDLRQEYMAMQLIGLFRDIFAKENIKIWMRPYQIVPYSSDSGLIEFIDDTRTISYLKEVSRERSLKNIYRQIFGANWEASITNFIESLAGYSLIQYYFDIKDRHNNNILIDSQGHIIHIDFSFMLSSSPGNMNFERAPFKLTQDYLELMEGEQSDIFQHFKLLFFLGVKYLRKYKKDIMELIMMMTDCPGLKCFIKFDRQRLESKFL